MFRFTIRDVLWLTVVVGLGIGLALDHYKIVWYQNRLDLSEFKLRVATRALEDNGFEVVDTGRGIAVQPKGAAP